MGHGIEETDRVFSTTSSEWHKLAIVPESGVIDDDTVASILHPIREGKVYVNFDNVYSPMPYHKALVADLRETRPEFIGTENEFVPLHLPKNSYHVISNRDIWEMLKEALKDLGVTIVTAGTLEGCKKFFVSVDLGTANFCVNGDNFLGFLDIVSSHDGTLALKVYDSLTRIVCMNTLRWSLETAGEVGFTLYHTKNAGDSIKFLPELIQAVLTGRAQFQNSMEYLNSIEIDYDSVIRLSLGYLIGESGLASTRTVNAAQNIAYLFKNGAGNNGKTLYDALQGATDYWTNGDGTGKKSEPVSKLYKSKFGAAADHKNSFCNLLMSGPENIAKISDKGRIALNTYNA